jgi:hypothetical protein
MFTRDKRRSTKSTLYDMSEWPRKVQFVYSSGVSFSFIGTTWHGANNRAEDSLKVHVPAVNYPVDRIAARSNNKMVGALSIGKYVG